MKRVLSALFTVCVLASCGGGSSDDGSAQTDGEATSDSSPATQAPVTDASDVEQPDTEQASDDNPPSSGADFGDIPAGVPVDACALLAPGEIESLLGSPADGVAEDVPPLFFGCQWETETSFVAVDVISHADTEAAHTSYDMFLGDVTEVDGIGDAALYNVLVDLAFLIDNYEVSVTLSSDFDNNDGIALEPAREIAALVIPRLP